VPSCHCLVADVAQVAARRNLAAVAAGEPASPGSGVLPGVERGPVERLIVVEQAGEFGDRRLSRPEATLTIECPTRTSKVLIVRTVEATFLTSSARSIERTPASWEAGSR
jgi:hypothetical protein